MKQLLNASGSKYSCDRCELAKHDLNNIETNHEKMAPWLSAFFLPALLSSDRNRAISQNKIPREVPQPDPRIPALEQSVAQLVAEYRSELEMMRHEVGRQAIPQITIRSDVIALANRLSNLEQLSAELLRASAPDGAETGMNSGTVNGGMGRLDAAGTEPTHASLLRQLS